MCVIIHDDNVHYDDNVQFITQMCVVIKDDNAHYEYMNNVLCHHDKMCVVIIDDNVHCLQQNVRCHLKKQLNK